MLLLSLALLITLEDTMRKLINYELYEHSEGFLSPPWAVSMVFTTIVIDFPSMAAEAD